MCTTCCLGTKMRFWTWIGLEMDRTCCHEHSRDGCVGRLALTVKCGCCVFTIPEPCSQLPLTRQWRCGTPRCVVRSCAWCGPIPFARLTTVLSPRLASLLHFSVGVVVVWFCVCVCLLASVGKACQEAGGAHLVRECCRSCPSWTRSCHLG